MTVRVQFFSWFKDITGCATLSETLPEGSTLEELFQQLVRRFPKFASLERSVLMAVGVEYQDGAYTLKDGDEVSLFPPVQGG